VLRQPLRFDFGRCQILECGIAIWELDENDPAMKAPGIGKGQNSRLELCFDTEDFEEDVKHVLSCSPKMLHDVAEEAWGQRTIRFFDPDGNLIELGESIPCFCRRLYSDGMTIEQVASKTGVAADKVREYVGD
jgi:catechol 2,3-dioxygenase-like lactoylglutathione lyase family enzyme